MSDEVLCEAVEGGWPDRAPSERELKALAEIAEMEELARQGRLERIKAGELHWLLRFAEKEGLLKGIMLELGYSKPS